MSPGTGRRYPLTMVCEVWRVARSTVYTIRARGLGCEVREPRKRGPKTEITDEELVAEIRGVLRESDFLGEGHRKVRARLRPKGIGVGKNRVLRLMRENGLLTPVRRGHPRGDRSHSGRITTDVPNELWGTDVGHRCHTVLHEGGRLVLVLRGPRSPCQRRRGMACGQEGRPLGGPRAGPPGRADPHGGLHAQGRARTRATT